MTPLPRWVLLALLLAVVAAHPVDHACVRLCRARNTSPESTGVCEHQLKLVLQSSGGRLPIRRLLRLCFTPYHGAGSSESPFFDDTEVCRVFRQSLIRRHGCTCEDIDDVKTGDLEEDRWRVQKFERDWSKKAEEFGMLRKDEEDRPMVPADDRGQQGPEMKALFEAIAKIGEAGEDPSSRAESKDEVIEISDPGSRVDEHNDVDDATIDWDLWCMAQCDSGQGANACNCDIVP
ncbi:PREDICTED: uncharacterized protein LOC108555477 [Eufriesea mexicana]|uniref:uncharacterized protein LOC108555477 n=1 Tax=Eufriesea mexicana TaxID=516756 RepID=UPI00083BC82A|nr:PREDICTED: uncharacterized protein LOC108555477 [Eufriesea mexicana]